MQHNSGRLFKTHHAVLPNVNVNDKSYPWVNGIWHNLDKVWGFGTVVKYLPSARPWV